MLKKIFNASESKTNIDESISTIAPTTPYLYDASNIKELQWPDTTYGEEAKKFLVPILKNGIADYASNIHGEMFALHIDDLVLPVLVPQDSPENSYICSPYHHYITLGKENINLLNNALLIKMVRALLFPVEKMVNSGRINAVVYVNHWLSSTDLYPGEISELQLSKIIHLLQKRFPDRAIIFRSLNAISTPDLLEKVTKLHCRLLPSRYVYLTDCCDENIFKTRILKSDLKLWNQNPLEYITEQQCTFEYCRDFLHLEKLLYVIQHSQLHPQYEEDYIHLLYSNELLHFKSFRRNGICVGVAGYFERCGVMYCPFLGYDKQDPDHALIFRLLNTALLLEAKERKCLFHQSAGASFYKSVRRAQGTLEYSAIYTSHLPRKQKTLWFLFTRFMNVFGPTLMRRY